MLFYFISLILIILYCGLILYYRFNWLKTEDFIPASATARSDSTFITVIIAARNEEKNIGACLNSIIQQTYPKRLFEIILVDDHSTDTTVNIANSFENDNIKIIHLKDFIHSNTNSYKKVAIETAISIAKGNLIVTTDADCIVTKHWLENIASFYAEHNSAFMAAPVVYRSPLSTDPILVRLLKVFQSLDFLSLQGITAASVSGRFHNMCNGANLAYTKNAFLKVSGFDGIDNIASGDDMLLMQKIQKVYPDKIGYIKSKNVIVETEAANSLPEFINQRIRWASKADKYTDGKITSVLLLVYLFNVWILITGISASFSLSYFYLFTILIVLKTIIELYFLFPVARFFGKQKLLWWFFPAQPFHILYIIVAGWLGKFGSYKWKDRKVK
ncbi:MAG: glycosyltransferase [Ginsengibacter sp.]